MASTEEKYKAHLIHKEGTGFILCIHDSSEDLEKCPAETSKPKSRRRVVVFYFVFGLITTVVSAAVALLCS